MKIAILAYGSITRNLHSHYSQATLNVKDSFQESGITIPTSFLDASSCHLPNQSRICLLANNNPCRISRKTKVYYASHSQDTLDQALKNFMEREGTRDLSHVAIIKNPLLLEQSLFSSLSFHPEKIFAIENWLTEKEYDYALIAQFPQKITLEEIQLFLKQNKEARERTLLYFLGLPEDTQEAHRGVMEFLGIELKNEIRK
jgi:hypothetical protein